MGLAVPERAVWLRTLLAEHTRILSHCGFLSWVGRTASQDASPYALREKLRTQTRRLTGNRIHPMANRIGGLAVDADTAWLDDEMVIMSEVRRLAAALHELIAEPVVATRTAGIATLRPEVINQYGVSGPAARASGVDLDLRRQQPYLGYPDLAEMITPPATTSGDAQARLALLAEEMIISASLVDACVDRLRSVRGPTAVKLGKIIRLPEGDGYLAVEAPLGLAGVFVSSRGEKTPWRMRLRTPSFSNISVLESLLVGVGVDALEAALASVGYVVGDIDK
jgi:NADH-quinone oxidoreductase subunit D